MTLGNFSLFSKTKSIRHVWPIQGLSCLKKTFSSPNISETSPKIRNEIKILNIQFDKDFFIKNNVISKNQYRFVGNKGTKDAIASLMDYLFKNLDARQCSVAVMLDFSTVFNTVLHNKLKNLKYTV